MTRRPTSKRAECLENAAFHRVEASLCTDPTIKVEHLWMARAWEHFAENYGFAQSDDPGAAIPKRPFRRPSASLRRTRSRRPDASGRC
jgi:hypothetical protein